MVDLGKCCVIIEVKASELRDECKPNGRPGCDLSYPTARGLCFRVEEGMVTCILG